MFYEIQNNNPGNIRWSPLNNWEGQTGKDYRGFVIFSSLYYGVRAMVKLILNYISSGSNTITEIVTRYAPPMENNTTSIINFVSDKTGIDPNMDISGSSTAIQSVVYWMIVREGSEAAPQILISTAYNSLSSVPEANMAGSNILFTLGLLFAAIAIPKNSR